MSRAKVDIIKKYKELRKKPGKFNIIDRNCSTIASQITGAGGILPEGISGIDTPKDFIKELKRTGANCFNGYTEMLSPNDLKILLDNKQQN